MEIIANGKFGDYFNIGDYYNLKNIIKRHFNNEKRLNLANMYMNKGNNLVNL